jgi:predicted permease
LPPYGGISSEVDIPGKSHSEKWEAIFQLCSEGYFATLGRPLVLGRLLSASEVDSARHVAVINQTLAHKYFGKENPIGQKIKFKQFDNSADGPKNAYFDIIGVVADAKNRGLQEDIMPEAFIPYTVTGAGERGILVRTAMDPDAMLASVRRVVWGVDHNVALTLTGSLESYLQRFSYSQPEFGLVALGIFAGIGLALVIIGVFSVMAYAVSLQTRDIGIRMALGAGRNTILAMILSKGLRLVAIGLAIGLAASLTLTRLMSSQIWGVSATDPLTFSGVVAVVMGVGVVACLVPARRATEVDPLVSLRYE